MRGQASAVIDRVRRAIAGASDAVSQRIGPIATSLGRAFGVDDWRGPRLNLTCHPWLVTLCAYASELCFHLALWLRWEWPLHVQVFTHGQVFTKYFPVKRCELGSGT